LFMTRAGVKLLHVPYKGGQEAARAVLTGEVDLLFGALSSSIAYVQTGKVKALGSTGPTRYAVLPDVPTIAESGLPGYEITAWHERLGTQTASVTVAANETKTQGFKFAIPGAK